jgi:hypothetical protein
MSSDDSSKLIPDCMEQVGINQYKCKKLGFVIQTNTLPIHCTLCGSVKMPSVLDMAKNATKAAVNFVKDGFKRVTEEQYKERIEQCNKNECGQFVNGRCAKCGCFLTLKAWAHSEECPLGFWKKLEN